MKSGAVVCVAALLAACGQTEKLGSFDVAPNGAPAVARSWMLPEARSENLLYIGDPGSGGVLVYAYLPSLKFVGVLAEPSVPGGECVDAAQDVFVTDEAASSHVTYEYAHGGSTPRAILADPGGTPSSCAVDPRTGDLAVTSVRPGVHGKLAIYRGAKGSPKLYGDYDFLKMMFCAYDGTGDLFVDGTPATSGFALAELAKGGTALQAVSLNQPIVFPGGVQWDGSHLAVGDDRRSAIYEFTISGSKGVKVGTTRLKVWSGVHQFFIDHGAVVDPTFFPSQGAVPIYAYPAGGKPAQTITGVSTPYSAVVSLAQK